MRILITGANGQLGMTFRSLATAHPEHKFFFYSSKELDITDPISIEMAFRESKPEIVINCAAYTAVDKAEDEPEKAFAVNAEGVKNIVDACHKTNSALIHISTDYVFDGTKNEPYSEEDEPNPINLYGQSKLNGEKYVLCADLKAMIIRTSWVYSEFGNNFVKTMMRLGKEHETVNVVNDQLGCPTYARDLALASLEIIDKTSLWSNKPTVFHFSNKGVVSWYKFAKEIMKHAHLNCEVNSIPTTAYPTKAERPHYTVLNCTKIHQDFELDIKPWEDSLKKALLSFQ